METASESGSFANALATSTTNRGSLLGLSSVRAVAGMLSLARFAQRVSVWKAEKIIVSPITAAHPTIKTISTGATIWGRAWAGGGTSSGSGRGRRGAVLNQGANAVGGS